MSEEGTVQSSVDFVVRRATSNQAASIYDLKVQAFGDNYLLYTIYQAPQSVRYIEQLISQGARQTGQDFFVIAREEQVLGYYHAVRRETEYFLNYIAVSKDLRQSGLGRTLLDYYESYGRDIGCSHLSLDVFESNASVHDWYLAHGYRQVGSSVHVRMAITALGDAGPELTCSAVSLQQALAAEQQWGFSKVEYGSASESVTVGLIGGQACKILAFTGLSLEQAVAAVCRRFRPDRSTLIVSSLPQVPTDWQITSMEQALRLTKTVA